MMDKKACINIKNDDQACFYWSVVCGLFPSRIIKNKTSSYPHYKHVLKTDNLLAPMPLNQIKNFEKANNIFVNVYALELNKTEHKTFFTVAPVRLTKQKLEKHVNLLLVQNKYYPKVNDHEAETLRYKTRKLSITIATLATCLVLSPNSSVKRN